MLVSFAYSKIKCADELKLDTCSLYGKEGDTSVKYVKACGGGKMCDDDYDVGICVKPKELRDEGEKCTSSLECISGICTNKKCAIKKANEACERYYECGKSAVCRDKVCKPLSGKDGECTGEYHCQIGLTCSNNKCIEKFSLDVGKETDEENACKTGKRQNGKCATYTVEDSTCTPKDDGNDMKKMFCKAKVNDGTSDSVIDQYCFGNWDVTWNDKYICPTEAYSKWDKYVEEFKKRYDKLSDDDKKDAYINRNTLNNNKVRDAYAEFIYYRYINFDDDCIKEYYYQKASSRFMNLPLFLISFILLSLF